MKEEQEYNAIYTTLTTDFGRFNVSTGYRRSSAVLAYDSWYYETLAWSLDKENKRVKIVADNSGAVDIERALEQHNEVCRQLIKNGEYVEAN